MIFDNFTPICGDDSPILGAVNIRAE